MQVIEPFLAMPDGSRVVCQAKEGIHPTILYCSRDALHAEGTRKHTGAFRDEGFGVLVYQAPYEVEARLKDPEVQKLVPPDSIEFRVQSLMRAMAALDPPPSLIVGHSSGARIVSLVADACHVRGIILFGYPFKSPRHDDEPERYAHLAMLKTPCLIIQGDQDEYGGADIAGKYPLSPSVRLRFVKGTHHLQMPSEIRAEIFDEIYRLMRDLASPGQSKP